MGQPQNTASLVEQGCKEFEINKERFIEDLCAVVEDKPNEMFGIGRFFVTNTEKTDTE